MTSTKKYISFGFMLLMAFGCQSNTRQEEKTDEDTAEQSKKTVSLTGQQVKALGIRIDSISHKNLSTTIEANGILEVPPQNEAAVTSVIGANVVRIEVIEGDKIQKGQVLAWLSHPDLFQLQTEYIHQWNQLQYLEQDYQRQQKLYDATVGSGKDFQKIKAEFGATQGKVKGLEGQLKLLGIQVERLQEGELYEQVPVKSPIGGYIKAVAIKTGQYVSSRDLMFEVVNIDHIHADLMVFEKDIFKVHVGQKVRFSVQNSPGEEMMAEIYAVGKSFEQEPKAVHIHAEIENKKGLLIPGMYVRGRVLVEENSQKAMPEEAVIREGEKAFLFLAEPPQENSSEKWNFTPVEIRTGVRDNGWVEVNFMDTPAASALFVMNQAYYLGAEMNKGEGGHH